MEKTSISRNPNQTNKMNDNLTEEELAALKATANENEWNAACDRIKDARSGQYPPDWWTVMMQSGLSREIMARWPKPGSPEIQITILH